MYRILIVDDEPTTRFVLAEMLKEDGYAVFEAKDGNEGIRLLDLKSPDLVITDLFMPDMDGIEFINHIRTNCPEVPVFAMSAGGVNDTIGPRTPLNTAGLIGAQKVFLKPVLHDVLLAEIKKILPD